MSTGVEPRKPKSPMPSIPADSNVGDRTEARKKVSFKRKPSPTSDAEAQLDGDDFMDTAVPLLKEYTEKLQVVIGAVNDLRKDHDQLPNSVSIRVGDQVDYLERRWSAMRGFVGRLQEPIQELDRRISQMIEHGHFDSEIDRIELKLRLNELESSLNAANELVNCPLARLD